MIVGDILKHHAKRHPNKVAIVFGDRRYTYKQFLERVDRLATALEHLRLKKGDRVCFLANNCPEYLEVLFAAAKIGLIFVPISFRFTSSEILYVVRNAEPRVLFTSNAFRDRIEDIANQMETVERMIYLEEKVDGMASYENLINSHSPQEPTSKIEEDEDLMIYYTSGSTGNPKGVILTHRLAYSSCVNVSLGLGLNENDTALLASPMYHGAGTWRFFSHLYIGGRVVILERFDPVEVLKNIEKEKITTINLAPTAIILLLEAFESAKYDLSSLRIIASGAAPLPVEILRKATEAFGPIIMNVYGLTEALGGFLTYLEPGGYIHEGDPKEVRRRASSCGREAFNVDVRVVNPEGDDVRPGEIGEIIVRQSPDITMKSYWRLPEATSKILRNGWLYTGDLATVDEDGYIFITDRKDFMIISGGENIYPKEVEDIIYEHPAVREACVVGIPDDKWGEAVKAVLVLKEGIHVTESDIIKFCKQHMAGYKAPKAVEFVSELPKDAVGKILRKKIKDWQQTDHCHKNP
jgi:long-chain acyl-CoA synthetase